MVNRQPVRERGRREAQPVAFQSNLAHFFSIQGLLRIMRACLETRDESHVAFSLIISIAQSTRTLGLNDRG